MAMTPLERRGLAQRKMTPEALANAQRREIRERLAGKLTGYATYLQPDVEEEE